MAPVLPQQPCEISSNAHLHCCGHLGFREELHQDVTQCCHCNVMSRCWRGAVLSGLLATDTCWTRGAAGERETRPAPRRYSAVRPTGSPRHHRLLGLLLRLSIYYLRDYGNNRQHTLHIFFLRSGLQVIMLGSSIWWRYLFYYFMTKEVQQLPTSRSSLVVSYSRTPDRAPTVTTSYSRYCQLSLY